MTELQFLLQLRINYHHYLLTIYILTRVCIWGDILRRNYMVGVKVLFAVSSIQTCGSLLLLDFV